MNITKELDQKQEKESLPNLAIVDGPIGVGKSYTIARLVEIYGNDIKIKVIGELDSTDKVIEEALHSYLRFFYANIDVVGNKLGMSNQFVFMMNKLTKYLIELKDANEYDLVVIDRGFISLLVFAILFGGEVSEFYMEEFSIGLNHLIEELGDKFNNISIFMLHDNDENIKERILKRNRDGESDNLETIMNNNSRYNNLLQQSYDVFMMHKPLEIRGALLRISKYDKDNVDLAYYIKKLSEDDDWTDWEMEVNCTP